MQLMSSTLQNFFMKMGDLHTEMAFLSAIGDWFEGSGWTEIYEIYVPVLKVVLRAF